MKHIYVEEKYSLFIFITFAPAYDIYSTAHCLHRATNSFTCIDSPDLTSFYITSIMHQDLKLIEHIQIPGKRKFPNI